MGDLASEKPAPRLVSVDDPFLNAQQHKPLAVGTPAHS